MGDERGGERPQCAPGGAERRNGELIEEGYREPEGARNRRVTSGNPAFLQANGAEGRRGGGGGGTGASPLYLLV